MKICVKCVDHKLIYDKITSREECECYCHLEEESSCVSDPCCR
ncbi:MAG: hypothetical protein QW416_06230 [Candidatus Nitrosocaldaceae archaeon]